MGEEEYELMIESKEGRRQDWSAGSMISFLILSEGQREVWD